jgi:formylglycine-generating enzyme required for sulfatase activity
MSDVVALSSFTAALLSFATALSVGACDRSAPTPVVVAAATPAPTHCSDDMALVAVRDGGVCVDRYEGALEGWRFSEPPGSRAATLRAIPARGTKPQVNISEPEAEAACERAGKRLCTEEEWTAACRGPQRSIYPYGNGFVSAACNVERPSPVQRVLGSAGGRLDDPRLAESTDGIEPGGAFPKCVTPSGIFDMNGNVHEWVSSTPSATDPRHGEFLGGFFADAKENGDGCAYKTTAHFKEYFDYSIGFRCCKDAT